MTHNVSGKSIVLLFSAGIESGFGRNAIQVGNGLYNLGWNVTLLDKKEGKAIKLNGDPVFTERSFADALSIAYLTNVANEVNASCILLFTDFPDFELYDKILHTLPVKPPLIGYAPIDGILTGYPDAGALGVVDRLVVFSEDAKKEVIRIAGNKPQTTPWLDSTPAVIAHPVAIGKFFPLHKIADGSPGPERAKTARALLYPGQPDLHDAFIVLNGNGAWIRKFLDLTIKGFSLFATGKSSYVKLCLPAIWKDKDDANWILSMARDARILDRLLPPPASHVLYNKLTDDLINTLYNACDIGINTAGGEGWGLVSFEHAATGAAQIVPGIGSMKEIWGDAAQFLEWKNIVSINDKYDWQLSTPEIIAENLNLLYNDHTKRQQLANAGYMRAISASQNIEQIALEWDRLLKQVIS